MRFNVKTGSLVATLAGAALAATLLSAPARADVVGELSCAIAPGEGAIVVSQRAVQCVFHGEGPVQHYTGVISRLGVDIGPQNTATLTYNVLAIGAPAPGSLAGDYVGPGFGLTLGTGGGLNALVGGGNSFALQPISATTSTGINFNAGVGELHLAFAGLEEPPMVRHHRRRHHRHH